MGDRTAFHLKRRMIVMCDFDRIGFKKPEMTKRRRVVVLRIFWPIALVVPLSATEPRPIRLYHAQIEAATYRSLAVRVWAKCNMITHVYVGRLESVQNLRRNVPERLTNEDFQRILVAVGYATGT